MGSPRGTIVGTCLRVGCVCVCVSSVSGLHVCISVYAWLSVMSSRLLGEPAGQLGAGLFLFVV